MRAWGWLLWRELKAEWRSREAVWTALLFCLASAVGLGFALDPVQHDLRPLFPGLVGVVQVFAAVLVMARVFAREREAGGLDGLRVLPVDPAGVLLAKAAASSLMLLLLQALAVPLLAALLGFRGPFAWGRFAAALALATVGLSLAGTVVAALASYGRAAEALLPVLLLPLVLPVMLALARIGAGLVEGLPPAQVGIWYRLLAAYDMVFSVIVLAVADELLAD